MTSEFVKSLIDKAYEEKASFLDLGNCGLNEIPEDILILAPFLKSLNLGSIFISDKGVTVSRNSENLAKNIFAKMDSFKLLESLHLLSEIHIRDVGINHLNGYIDCFQRIEYLDVGYNNIKDNDLRYIFSLAKLKSLDIDGCEISGKGFKEASESNNLQRLNVRFNRIDDNWVKSIIKFPQLESLNISQNYLSDKGSEFISKLSLLKNLDISSNNIGEKGVEWVSKLKKLESLNVGRNIIGSRGAEYISNLSVLKELDIAINIIGSRGTEHISQISSLERLNIGTNFIGDNGVWFLKKLSSLIYLDISGNNIGSKGLKYIEPLSNLEALNISNNRIDDFCEGSIIKLKKIKKLDIRSNIIKSERVIGRFINSLPNLVEFKFDKRIVLGLAAEIYNDYNSLRTYFNAKEKTRNTNVKIILIGNTNAGKSSLANFLCKKSFYESQGSTHGIKVSKWYFLVDGIKHSINIWDFGGQDYFHATHNIFLRDKAFFLLLHTSKALHSSNGSHSFEQWFSPGYWLGNIRDVSQKASVIWSLRTKADMGFTDEISTIDKKRYEVSGDFCISVRNAFLENEAGRTDIDFKYFEEKLKMELSRWGDEWILNVWIEIRDIWLPIWREEFIYVRKEKFSELCTNVFENRSEFFWEMNSTADGFVEYLRRVGEIVVFDENEELKNYIFLSAIRLTNEIYSTVLNSNVIDQQGVFDSEKVKKKHRSEIQLYLLILSESGLVFYKNKTKVVIPQYLPMNDTTEMLREDYPLRLVIYFPDYMSRSMMSRFVVRYARQDSNSRYWRNAVFFKQNGVRLLVHFNVFEKKVYIHAIQFDEKSIFNCINEIFLFVAAKSVGDKISENYLWSMEDNYVDKMYNISREERFLVQANLQLSINDSDFITVKNIKNSVSFGVNKIKTEDGRYIDQERLYKFLFSESVFYIKKLGIVSSRADEQYLKEFSKHLNPLVFSKRIEVWESNSVLPGDDDKEILKRELKALDFLVLLVSVDLFSEENTFNIIFSEIESKDSKLIIIPLFVRNCDYESSILKDHCKKNGLPRNDKQEMWLVDGINTNTDKWYADVVKGLKDLIT